MSKVTLSLREMAMIVGTRAALGVGIGLLIGGAIEPKRRRRIGWALVGMGVATTLPLGIHVLGKTETDSDDGPGVGSRIRSLLGADRT